MGVIDPAKGRPDPTPGGRQRRGARRRDDGHGLEVGEVEGGEGRRRQAEPASARPPAAAAARPDAGGGGGGHRRQLGGDGRRRRGIAPESPGRGDAEEGRPLLPIYYYPHLRTEPYK